jgi:hypothetical protein
MAANTSLSVTGLDFATIRSNLQSFIAAKPDFADFNFDDSAIGTLLDLLAYNTYYNAFYANMAVNESFLDTAQLYENVASHAKELGYTPRSAQGSTANVKVTFNSAVSTDVKSTLTIPKNTEFNSSVNGVSYTFVTPTTYTFSANSTTGFSDYVELVEGIPLQQDFVFTAANTAFVLQNDDVDTRSISIQVSSSGTAQTYNLASDLKQVNSSSKVFFVESDRAFRYKVLFGDGVLGKKPLTNDVITVDYRVCSGSRTNGANTFSSTASIDSETDYTLTSSERATGGVYAEGIEDIRFNAPRAYETQNRAVTVKDYERIIIRENAKIQAARVWGGEENDPPIYGKVYACVKPKVGTVISSSEKNRININLEKYNVQSIDVEFVDPTYLYIRPTIQVRFDPESTSKTADQIGNAIATQVSNYETSYLNSFDGSFRYSRFLDLIDSSDSSIVGSQATVYTEKRFRPVSTSSQNYVINFNRSLEHPHDGHQYAISSSSFTYKGTSTCYFDDDGWGKMRIYYLANRSRIYLEDEIGTVNYNTGQVKLTNLIASGYGTDLAVIAKLVAFNVNPIRNQVLLISGTIIDVINDNTNLRESRINATTLGTTTTMNETNLLTLTSY